MHVHNNYSTNINWFKSYWDRSTYSYTILLHGSYSFLWCYLHSIDGNLERISVIILEVPKLCILLRKLKDKNFMNSKVTTIFASLKIYYANGSYMTKDIAYIYLDS